jgi:hypothetical protein
MRAVPLGALIVAKDCIGTTRPIRIEYNPTFGANAISVLAFIFLTVLLTAGISTVLEFALTRTESRPYPLPDERLTARHAHRRVDLAEGWPLGLRDVGALARTELIPFFRLWVKLNSAMLANCIQVRLGPNCIRMGRTFRRAEALAERP